VGCLAVFGCFSAASDGVLGLDAGDGLLDVDGVVADVDESFTVSVWEGAGALVDPDSAPFSECAATRGPMALGEPALPGIQ